MKFRLLAVRVVARTQCFCHAGVRGGNTRANIRSVEAQITCTPRKLAASRWSPGFPIQIVPGGVVVPENKGIPKTSHRDAGYSRFGALNKNKINKINKPP